MTALAEPQHVLDYLVELGSALMSAGCPVHRLEELLVALAGLEGYQADVFAVPTGLFVTVRAEGPGPSLTTMVRVREWGTDLERMAELDEVLNLVADRKLGIPEARRRIQQARGAGWSTLVQLLAGVGACAGAAVSFGGGLADSCLAGLGGLALQGLRLLSVERRELRVLENLLGGVVAGLVAWLGSLLWPVSREVLVLAIVIPLLPGLTLTTGLSELSYRNLVAGTARLMHATVTLVSLVFGIVLVLGLESSLGLTSTAAAAAAREPAGWAVQLVALVVASLSFGVVLGLPAHRLPIALASGALAWLLQAATRGFAGSQGVFATSLVLAAVANLYARRTQRPAQLFLMPGMLLLVPGALSFRSLEALLRGDYVTGATQFVDVLQVAGALVMGLLVASVVAPPKKAL
jgi:uncharacterized membrane protein YjjP (DUF1212 family)